MDNDKNDEQGSAAEEDAGSISLALDALSQLHAGAFEGPPPHYAAQDAAAGDDITPRPEGDPATAEAPEPLNNLQSALDSYKDWLSSI